MNRIQSVSLLALLTINASAVTSTESDKALIAICNEINGKEALNNTANVSPIESYVIIDEMRNNRLSEDDIKNVCNFLIENNETIESQNSTLSKNGGWTL